MRKKATQAAAKQPGVTTSQPDGESAPGAVDTQPAAGAPEAATTEATPAEVSTAAARPDEDNLPEASDSVELEVVTALPRRIRSGVVVTNEPQRVHVSEAVAAELEADPHVKVVRK